MAQRSKTGWWKWLLIAAILAAGGYFYFHHNHGPAVTYSATPVTRNSVTNAVTATGTLNPVVNVTVGSQVSGRISKLNVDFNSVVKSNEVIAEIDPATYQAAVEQANADLANAEANLELQQVECRRSSDLFTNKLISGSDYDTAVANLHEAEATVKIKKASVYNATVNLDYCKIVSPVDGVVISRAVELGQTVASSFTTPTIFQIANDLTRMQIDSNVAEADVGGVVEGQMVSFTVDAYPDRVFSGKVVQVRNSPTTVNNVVTYDCVISVTNADYKLKPGMTANVTIPLAERDGVLTIPNGALRFRPPDAAVMATNSPADSSPATNVAARPSEIAGGHPDGGHPANSHPHNEHSNWHTVFLLVEADGISKLRSIQIKTGISDGIVTEVVSGLEEGAKVVTSAVVSGGSPPASPGFPRMR
jgi:HlyD family secretion protein